MVISMSTKDVDLSGVVVPSDDVSRRTTFAAGDAAAQSTSATQRRAIKLDVPMVPLGKLHTQEMNRKAIHNTLMSLMLRFCDHSANN